MFYRNSGITGKTPIELSTTIKTMSDISIVMTLSTLPTKRCGLYSITQQRTLGMDSNGHLCYWFYDGNNDRCLNGSTVLSGTNVKVGAIHSRNGVRLYVNGTLDAFCEAPLWSEGCNLSYIGTHGLAPSDLEMDGVISGVLLTDYAMTDDEMSVASWNSELCVNDNRLFYVPSRTTLHVDDSLASSLNEGHVYVLEDTGSLVMSNEEKLPCWYLGEYNSTTQDVTLNISDKKGGGTYNRMEVDHLMVHDIDVADTGHTVEADGEDVYPYLAINEYNNAIFTNPHISTMKVEYHCTASVVSNPNTITVWGSSYDDTFPYIYAKYTITYKDGASGTIITVVRDPSHQQYMVRTVTCYVESTSSTYTWPTDPTQFASGTTLSFYGRNAHAGKYQFTRQWTWFGIDWFASSHSDRPNASIVTGFTSGHWVSGSETALFVVDDDYLRNIVVVEDVVSQSVKDYATSQSQPVSSYMGKKMLPSSVSGGYALSDSNGSLQAKDCYLEEIHSDGFSTSKTTVKDLASAIWGWDTVIINTASELQFMKFWVDNLGYNSQLVCEGQMRFGRDGDYITSSRLTWDMFDTPPTFEFDGLDRFYFRNWGTTGKVIQHTDLYNFLVNLQTMTIPSVFTEFNTIDNQYNLHGRLYMKFTDDYSKEWTVHNLGAPFEPEISIVNLNGKVGIKYGSGCCTVINPDGQSLGGLNLTFTHSTDTSDPARIHITLSFPFNGVTELKVCRVLEYPTTVRVNYGNGEEKTMVMGIKSYGGTYRDESNVLRVRWRDWFIQGRVDVELWLILCYNAIDCYEYYTRHIPTSLSENPTYEDITGGIFTDMTTLDMELQTWSVGGLVEARNLVPLSKEKDEYVSKYGAMLGKRSLPWDMLFTKGISYGKHQISRPYSYGNGCYAMFLFDNYIMMWGNFTTASKTVYFPITMNSESYFVISDVGIGQKGTVFTQFSGSSTGSHWWMIIGKHV